VFAVAAIAAEAFRKQKRAIAITATIIAAALLSSLAFVNVSQRFLSGLALRARRRHRCWNDRERGKLSTRGSRSNLNHSDLNQVRVSVMFAPLNSLPDERITTDWEFPFVVATRSAENAPALTTT